MPNKFKLKRIKRNQKSISVLMTIIFCMKNYRYAVWVSYSIIILGLTGCYRSVSPNFYTLTPEITALASSPVKLIEVLPVVLPQRLESPLMVLQDTNGRSYKLDQQRWSSSLGDELHSGLSAGLQQKLGAIDIYQNGLSGGRTWYMIATEFSRFDIVERANQTATDIEVMVAWVIKRHDAHSDTITQKQYPDQLSCRMSFKNPVINSGQGFLDIVKTYQHSLNHVIDAIAASTLAVEAQKKPSIDGVICF